MKRARPPRYFLEFIPITAASNPAYDPADPDPWCMYVDAPTKSEGEKRAHEHLAAGTIGCRVHLYQRSEFIYRPEDGSWDYSSEKVATFRDSEVMR